MAFIWQGPLLAFTGTTPKKDNPLLDIQEVTQNCKSLHQQNRIPKGDVLEALALHAPGFTDALAVSGDLHWRHETADHLWKLHTSSALEENHLGSQNPNCLDCAQHAQHAHMNTHLMQLADCIRMLQLGLVIAGTTNHGSVPAPPLHLRSLQTFRLRCDHSEGNQRARSLPTTSCSYTLKSDSMKVV